MILFWAAAMVVFLVVEAATVGLTVIWFALGSLAALISAAFNAPWWLQIVWFIVISGAALWFTRPLAKKFVNSKLERTNADRVIGNSAIVSERIDNLKATGTIHIDGKVWTARSDDGEPIDSGTLIVIDRIEGVKLIVRKHEEAETATV